jgi:outer membrane receptor for ferrienterochelin and colicin
LSRIFGSGAEVRLGIRNIFDQDIVAPAAAGTYPDDYQRPGREFWGGIGHDF